MTLFIPFPQDQPPRAQRKGQIIRPIQNSKSTWKNTNKYTHVQQINESSFYSPLHPPWAFRGVELKILLKTCPLPSKWMHKNDEFEKPNFSAHLTPKKPPRGRRRGPIVKTDTDENYWGKQTNSGFITRLEFCIPCTVHRSPFSQRENFQNRATSAQGIARKETILNMWILFCRATAPLPV